MNTNDLYLEYARVIQMCKNTELEDTPWVCVRWRKEDEQDWRYFSGGHPVFGFFKFGCIVESAVAVLEGKPVFVGDRIYAKSPNYNMLNGAIVTKTVHGNTVAQFDDGNQIQIHDFDNGLETYFTWTPSTPQPTPKRTFTLNGVELPCPVNDPVDGLMFNIHGNSFYFKTMRDRDSIIREFSRILTEARDKP